MSEVEVDLQEVLEVCLVAALASQKYVLKNLLRVEEVLQETTAQEATTPAMQDEISEDFKFCDVVPSSDADTQSDSVTGSPCETRPAAHKMLLSKAQQRRLTMSFQDSLAIESKGILDHRAVNATDLVTSADTAVQRIVVALLNRAFQLRQHDEAALPFTIIGEEDGDGPHRLTDDPAVTCAMAYAEEIAAALRATREPHPNGATEEEELVPHWRMLHAETAALADRGTSTIRSRDAAASRRRILVFIDPIDGTNAFVGGQLDVPMTLIGVAVDGIPVMGVVNRIFQTTVTGGSSPASLSYTLRLIDRSYAFVVLNGDRIPVLELPHCDTHRAEAMQSEEASCLTVTFSPSTKAEIMQPFLSRLDPRRDIPAQGAGNKLMMVAYRAALDAAKRFSPGGAAIDDSCEEVPCAADVFTTPNDAIKKWDTCAPHAILAALGGSAADASGTQVSYVPQYEDDCITLMKKASSQLSRGFVAAKDATVFSIVGKRLRWQ